MGNARTCMFVALVAACGSNNNNKTVDAAVDAVPDAPIDAKVFMDAPAPTYDFSCLGHTGPTTAPAMITLSGSTQELSMTGATSVADVTVSTHGTTVLGTTTSDAQGGFTMMVPTMGMPINGYLEAVKVMAMGGTQYRTSFLFPQAPLAMDTSSIPVLMISMQTFGLINQFAGGNQDDTANGAFFLLVTDCSNAAINGAMVSVKQGANSVGTVYDLSSLTSMAAGVYVVFNVPDGNADVTVSVGSTTFPVRTLAAHKQNNTDVRNGSMTVTQVRPGV